PLKLLVGPQIVPLRPDGKSAGNQTRTASILEAAGGEEGQCPSRSQSVNSAHVADARNPASASAWRSDSHQRGSYARRRASAEAAQAKASSAARAAITIAPAVRWRLPERALVAGRTGSAPCPETFVEGLDSAVAPDATVLVPAGGLPSAGT